MIAKLSKIGKFSEVRGSRLKSFGSHGAILLLSQEELPLVIVPESKVLGFQLSQGLGHLGDEGLVLPLLHSVDLGYYPIINWERHKSWNRLW